MNKEEIIQMLKNNPIKIIKWEDIEIPVEYLKQTTVNVNGYDYIRLQQENKQLQERIEYLERSNNRREDTILEQRQEINDLGDNWDKLKEYINRYIKYDKNGRKISKCLNVIAIMNKINKLEQGSDSNV